MTPTRTGAASAIAAALVLTTATIPDATAERATIRYEAVDSCQGTSACAVAPDSRRVQTRGRGQRVLQPNRPDCDTTQPMLATRN
jgi:hypothetical protein